MTKKEFETLTGEKCEDVLGSDWENILAEGSFTCPANNCGNPKMPDEGTCGDSH